MPNRLLTMLLLLLSLTFGVSLVSAQDATAEPTAEAAETGKM